MFSVTLFTKERITMNYSKVLSLAGFLAIFSQAGAMEKNVDVMEITPKTNNNKIIPQGNFTQQAKNTKQTVRHLEKTNNKNNNSPKNSNEKNKELFVRKLTGSYTDGNESGDVSTYRNTRAVGTYSAQSNLQPKIIKSEEKTKKIKQSTLEIKQPTLEEMALAMNNEINAVKIKKEKQIQMQVKMQALCPHLEQKNHLS